MTTQTLKTVQPIHTDYRIFECPPESPQIMGGVDVFEVEAMPRIVVNTKAKPNGKSYYTFYKGESRIVKTESSGLVQFIWGQQIKSINIIPELILGLTTLFIGLIGMTTALIAEETTAMLSMIGFALAGIITLIGSGILKKRVESTA